MLALTADFLAGGVSIQAWRHDAIYYLDDFDRKLTREGRWIFYALFNLVKATPPALAWLLGLLAHFVFFFVCATRATRHSTLSLAYALLALQFVPLQSQALWPGSTLLGGLTLLVAVVLAAKLPRWLFFVVAGLMMHGAYQHYYFMLPLLYLGDLANSKQQRNRASLWAFSGWWIHGFVAGFLLSSLVLYLLTDSFTVQLADWRAPNPALSVEALGRNLSDTAATIARDIRGLFQAPHLVVAYAALAAAALAYRSVGDALRVCAVLACVALSLYAALLPLGLFVPHRSALPLFAGAFSIVLLVRAPGLARTLVLCVCLLAAFLTYYAVNRSNQTWYRTITDTYIEDLNAIAARHGLAGAELVVAGGNARAYQARIERQQRIPAPVMMEPSLAHPTGDYDFRWRPAALASQFGNVRFCSRENTLPVCNDTEPSANPSACLNQHPNLCLRAASNGRAVIKLR